MGTIKIKLAVNTLQNRVLFADVGSDFVAILLSFLTLPLSAVQQTAGMSSPDCLSNLCNSVNRLREAKLLKVEACHGMLLRPTHTDEFKLCKSPCNYSGSVDVTHCKCCQVIARLFHVFNEVGRSETFVRGKERFVISDDWMIKPASTSGIQSLLQTFDSHGIGYDFVEVEACIGLAEVVSMLKASLSSHTIFTDVLLCKGSGSDGRAAHVPMKPNVNQEIWHQSSRDAAPESKIKLFYDRHQKKVMYAECNHEFVDLLLGFLTYPVGCVIKNTGAGTFPLCTSFHNLYISATELDAAGFLTGRFAKETLLNPGLAPFNMVSKTMCRPLNCRCTKGGENITCHACHPELVEDRKYVVDDDLLIHQASAMSLMKHWCRRDKAKVVEMDITVRKHDAAALLRAMCASNTALTDVFVGSRPMQIFVKTPMCTTITLDVASCDTIATVRRKIEDKLSIPAVLRHKLRTGVRYFEDSRTIAEYNITSGSTIESVVFTMFGDCVVQVVLPK